MTQFKDAPIFDADQHMYETPDALTRYLPKEFQPKVQFVQIGKHTRIAILNKITDYMPNPTFERVAAPGRAREVLLGAEHRRPVDARDVRAVASTLRRARATPRTGVKELDRQGVGLADLPDVGQPRRAFRGRRSRLTMAIIHALNQWMLEIGASPRQPATRDAGDQLAMSTSPAGTRLRLENGAKVALIKPATGERLTAAGARRRCPSSTRSGVTSRTRGCRLCYTPANLHCRNTSTSGNRRQPAARSRCRLSSGPRWATARSPT